MSKGTVLKDGVIYHKISKELYIQHKKDKWTDRRIISRYGMNNQSFTNWKKKNLTDAERSELSLNNYGSYNLPGVKQKPEEKAQDNKLVETLITEKELAYQKAKEWHKKYKELENEHAADKEKLIEIDRELIRERHNHNLTRQENERLLMQIGEMRRTTTPMRELLKVFL